MTETKEKTITRPESVALNAYEMFSSCPSLTGVPTLVLVMRSNASRYAEETSSNQRIVTYCILRVFRFELFAPIRTAEKTDSASVN